MVLDLVVGSWEYLHSICSPFHLFVTCTIAIHLLVYWPLCLGFMFLDIYKYPKVLYQYKIQKKKEHGWQSYKKTIKQALINQVVAFLFASSIYYITDWFNFGLDSGKELPSPFMVFIRLIGCVFVEEIGFFYSHYVFHNKYFYKPIHSFHHQFTAPVAMACVYAHPIEHVIANLLPLVMGPILCRGHVTELWLWLTIGIISTINGHSGYEFPFTPSAKEHDYHHESFKYNFGSIGLLDWLHGTAGARKETKRDW